MGPVRQCALDWTYKQSPSFAIRPLGKLLKLWTSSARGMLANRPAAKCFRLRLGTSQLGRGLSKDSCIAQHQRKEPFSCLQSQLGFGAITVLVAACVISRTSLQPTGCVEIVCHHRIGGKSREAPTSKRSCDLRGIWREWHSRLLLLRRHEQQAPPLSREGYVSVTARQSHSGPVCMAGSEPMFKSFK